MQTLAVRPYIEAEASSHSDSDDAGDTRRWPGVTVRHCQFTKV